MRLSDSPLFDEIYRSAHSIWSAGESFTHGVGLAGDASVPSGAEIGVTVGRLMASSSEMVLSLLAGPFTITNEGDLKLNGPTGAQGSTLTARVKAERETPFLSIVQDLEIEVAAASLILPAVEMAGISPLSTVPEGTELWDLGQMAPGEDRTISPNDGRWVFNADKSKVVRGLGAWTVGSYEVAVTQTHPAAINSPIVVSATIAVTDPMDVVLPEIYPGVGWAATPDSGYGAGTIPTATVRAEGIPQPWLNELFTPYQTIDGDWVFGFQSGARDHVQKLIAYCEGNTVESTAKSWHTYTDANGVSRKTFGYHFKFKHAEAMAISATGTCNIWVRAVPINNAVFAERVMGPYPVHPRATKYTDTLEVGPGRAYSSIKDALAKASEDYATANYRVMIMATGDYKIDCQHTSRIRTNTNRWTTICAAPGVTATIGSSTGTTFDADGTTRTDTRPGLNHLHFQGEGIRWELCKMASQFGGYYYFEPDGKQFVWLDGIEITQGTPFSGSFRSGTGAYALQDGREGGHLFANHGPEVGGPNIYYTEVHLHDVSSTGFGYGALIRHCEIARSSGTLMQSLGRRRVSKGATMNWAIHGVKASQMGGYDPDIGLALFNPGLTLEYEGAAAYVYFEKFCNNANFQVPLEIVNGGSGNPNTSEAVTFKEQTLTGGTGSGLKAQFTIVGGVVTAAEVTPELSSHWGAGYTPGDIVTWAGAGGTSVTLRVCGNIRVWEGASPQTAVVTHEHIIPKTERLQTFVDKVNATWDGWKATNNEVDRLFTTSHLSWKGDGVSVSMGIPKRLVTGSPKKVDLYCRMDIHSNILAFPAVQSTNGSIFALEAGNFLGGSPFSASGGLQDVGVESSSWADVTYLLEDNDIYGIIPEAGYWNQAQSHVVVRYSSFVNCSTVPNGHTRESCLMEQVFWSSIGAQAAGVGQEIKSCVIWKAPIPAAADIDSVMLGSGVDEEDIFINHLHPVYDLRPKDLGSGKYLLQLPSGKTAGLHDIDGFIQYVGWTDPEKLLPVHTELPNLIGQDGVWPIDLSSVEEAIPDEDVLILVPAGLPFVLSTSAGNLTVGATIVTRAEVLTLTATTVAASTATNVGPVQIRWRRNADGTGPIDSAQLYFDIEFIANSGPLKTLIIKAAQTFNKPSDFVTLDAIELWGPGGHGSDSVQGVRGGASGATGGASSITKTTLPDADWTSLTLEVGAAGSGQPTRVLLGGVEKARANGGGNATGATGGVAAADGVGEVHFGGQQGEAASVPTTGTVIGGASGAGTTSLDGVGKRGATKTSGRAGSSGGGVGGALSTPGASGNGFSGMGPTGGNGPTGTPAGAPGTAALPPTASTDGAGSSSAGGYAAHQGVPGLPGKILIATSTVDGENAYIAGGMAGGGASGTPGQWCANGGTQPDDCYGGAGSGGATITLSPQAVGGLGKQGVIIVRYYDEAQ